MNNRLTTLVTATLLAASCAACGGQESAGGDDATQEAATSASCDRVLSFGGRLYGPAITSNDAGTRSLGKGAIITYCPSSRDDAKAIAQGDRPVAVVELIGANASIALGVPLSYALDGTLTGQEPTNDQSEDVRVFLAQGTFPQLPTHPLHQLIYGSETEPSYRAELEKAGGVCKQDQLVEAVSLDANASTIGVLRVDVTAAPPDLGVKGSTQQVVVDAFTEFDGSLAREPSILGGRRLRLSVTECRASDDALTLLAKTVSYVE